MRICHVTDWYMPRHGGMELHIQDLAQELLKNGHEAEVLCATPGPSELNGVQATRFSDWLFPAYHCVWKPSTISRVEAFFRARQFDLVHCHTAFSPLSLMGVAMAKKCGIPSVLTEHSVLGFDGRIVLEALETYLGWSSWPDVITAVSRFVACEMTAVCRRKVEVMPNGVRPEDWWQSSQACPPTVVSMMRLRPRKRPLDLVQAIPLVQAQLPENLKPNFILIGDGPERPKILRALNRLGLSDELQLPGWLPREKIREILSRSSLFALPTVNEALSIAALEALSSGLPAVTRNQGGVSDVLTHGQDGYLADTFEEWVDYIVRLCRDRDLRLRLAARTRATAERFAWPRVIERHLEVYELARWRKSRRELGKNYEEPVNCEAAQRPSSG